MNALAIAGFALSMVALVWNAAVTWLGWPRIAVEIRPSMAIHVSPPGEEEKSRMWVHKSVIVTVINHGAEAITIRTFGLRSADGAHELDYEYEQRAGKPLPEGPSPLPIRIEGHDCKIWTCSYNLLQDFPVGTQMWGYADRYKSFRWLPRRGRPIVHRTKSESGLNRSP